MNKNTIYLKLENNKQKKIKEFNIGEKDKAIKHAYKLAYINFNSKYFIITEDNKCLNINKQIIL